MELSTTRICIFGLGLSLFVTPSAAWENDVHYGLTKWLALQAGFTEQQSIWIADGNVGIDKSPITEPVHTTFASACVGNADPTGSGHMTTISRPSGVCQTTQTCALLYPDTFSEAGMYNWLRELRTTETGQDSRSSGNICTFSKIPGHIKECLISRLFVIQR
jgi:hypothetical protein